MGQWYEWLVSWYTAPSVPKRAAAVVVKIVIEGAVVAAGAALVISPLVLLALTELVSWFDLQAVAGVWGAATLLYLRAEYCFLTSEDPNLS